MDYKTIYRKRKAISSVVGLFFFIVVMVGAFTAFILMMETNTEFLNTQLDISQHELAKLQEDFVIFAETQPYRNKNPPYEILEGHNQFNITVDVENKGKTPVEVVNLWIINKTLPSGAACETDSSEPCEANLIEVNYADSFVPVRSTVNLLENTPVTMQRGNYDLKVVTSLGNVKILPIRVGGPPLFLKLLANPPNVPNLSNVTLTYIVVNNSTKTLYDIKPFTNTLGEFATVKPDTALQGQNAWIQSGQAVISQLDPNEAGTFTVNYRLTGAKGSAVLFTTNVTAKKAPDSPDWSIFSNNDTARVAMQAEGGGDFGALKQRPEIFIVIPAPFGNVNHDDDRGFIGAIIVNPTNQTISVSRVSIFLSDGGGTNAKVIEAGTALDQIEPAGVGTTEIPTNNLLIWTNTDTDDPLEIQPGSSKEIISRVRSKVDGSVDLPGIIMGAVTHTSAGQYASISHIMTAVNEQTGTVINVYPTSKDVTGATLPDHADDKDFRATGTIDALETGNIFWVTIREANRNSAAYLPAESSTTPWTEQKLLIKLPPGFPEFDPVFRPDGTKFCQYGFDVDNILSREYRDGSIQIEIPLDQDLGNQDESDEITSKIHNDPLAFGNCDPIPIDDCNGGFCPSVRFSFGFSVDGPDLDKDEVYVYYAFANGFDASSQPLGPVSEAIVLRVNGKEGSCFGESPGAVINPVDEFTGDFVYIPNTDPPEKFEIICE